VETEKGLIRGKVETLSSFRVIIKKGIRGERGRGLMRWERKKIGCLWIFG
jgi:hypothetical protein